MFARMNALGDFVRVHAYPALRPHGFRKLAFRERLLAEFDDPASPVLRLGPTTRQVLLRLGRAGAAGIESLLAQLADHPSRSRFAAWTRPCLSRAAK